MTPLRHVPPVPPGFVSRFLADGWRGVERVYGCRTDLLLKWIELSGGEDLYAQRRAHMRDRSAGGNPAAGQRVRAAA